jgi:hypothetical protein
MNAETPTYGTVTLASDPTPRHAHQYADGTVRYASKNSGSASEITWRKAPAKLAATFKADAPAAGPTFSHADEPYVLPAGIVTPAQAAAGEAPGIVKPVTWTKVTAGEYRSDTGWTVSRSRTAVAPGPRGGQRETVWTVYPTYDTPPARGTSSLPGFAQRDTMGEAKAYAVAQGQAPRVESGDDNPERSEDAPIGGTWARILAAEGFTRTVVDIIAGAIVTIRDADGTETTGRARNPWTHDETSSDGMVFTRAKVEFTDGHVWTGSHSAAVKHHPARTGTVATVVTTVCPVGHVSPRTDGGTCAECEQAMCCDRNPLGHSRDECPAPVVPAEHAPAAKRGTVVTGGNPSGDSLAICRTCGGSLRRRPGRGTTWHHAQDLEASRPADEPTPVPAASEPTVSAAPTLGTVITDAGRRGARRLASGAVQYPHGVQFVTAGGSVAQTFVADDTSDEPTPVPAASEPTVSVFEIGHESHGRVTRVRYQGIRRAPDGTEIACPHSVEGHRTREAAEKCVTKLAAPARKASHIPASAPPSGERHPDEPYILLSEPFTLTASGAAKVAAHTGETVAQVEEAAKAQGWQVESAPAERPAPLPRRGRAVHTPKTLGAARKADDAARTAGADAKTFTPGQPVQVKLAGGSRWTSASYVRPSDERDASAGFHIVTVDGFKAEREIHPQRIRPHTADACAACHGARTNRPCILVATHHAPAGTMVAPAAGIPATTKRGSVAAQGFPNRTILGSPVWARPADAAANFRALAAVTTGKAQAFWTVQAEVCDGHAAAQCEDRAAVAASSGPRNA